MKKKGFTSARNQRWYCTYCALSTRVNGVDHAHQQVFNQFMNWITSPLSLQAYGQQIGRSRRQLARDFTWCWNVQPQFHPEHEPHHTYIQIDGTYLHNGWCLLIASDPQGQVINLQWAGSENTDAYRALLAPIPRPSVVVCDGNASGLKAVRQLWPDTKIQRCLVHVQRDMRRDLTTRPKSQAGKELAILARKLTTIHTQDKARAWLVRLQHWHDDHETWLKERSYARNHPDAPQAKQGQTWWWTHARVRRAYFRLTRLHARGQLFTFLENPPNTNTNTNTSSQQPIAATTNQIEGGINAPIKRALVAHRGLDVDHQKRLCEWIAYNTRHDARPDTFLSPSCWQPKPQDLPTPSCTTLPAVQEAHPGEVSTQEAYQQGFGIHHGWAGRSH